LCNGDKKHPAHNKRIYQLIENAKERKTKINYDLHTSGHASPAAIEDVYNAIKPDKLIPFHCEEPEDFKELSIPSEKVITMNDEDIYDVVAKKIVVK
jgi:mRNA degradation ribonuclease J1/J2